MKGKLLVCDLDGTLSDHTPRMHLAAAGDWDAYHQGLGDDLPNEAVLWMVKAMKGSVVFLTGRPEEYRARTVAWLEGVGLYEGEEYQALLMRGKGVFGSDVDIKPQALQDWIQSQEGQSLMAEASFDAGLDGGVVPEGLLLILEDRDKVVARWRDLGYDCWQVTEGSF